MVLRDVLTRFELSCNMAFEFYFGQNLGSKRATHIVNLVILNSLLARNLSYVKICVCYVSNLKDNRGVPWLARKTNKEKKKKNFIRVGFGFLSPLGLRLFLAQQKKENKMKKKGSVWYL